MSAATTLNLECVELFVIQNVCLVEGAMKNVLPLL